MFFKSLIISLLAISFASFAQSIPSSLTGHYRANGLSCTFPNGFYEIVKDITIGEKVVTLDTCADNDDCEGRMPYSHFYLDNIRSEDGWVVADIKTWTGTRFKLKRQNPGSLTLKVELLNANSEATGTCTANLTKI